MKSKINNILLGLLAFFATWGEGMQMVLSKASLVFPVLIILFIVLNYNYAFNAVKKYNILPKEFKHLFIFIFFHSLLFVLLNLGSIGFGTQTGDVNEEGYSFGTQDNGIIIVRYFLFLIFCVFLTVSLLSEKNLKIFGLFYSIGFISTIVLGGAYHGYAESLIRISGGLKDPNAMAFDALVSMAFSLFLFKRFQSKPIRFIILVSLIIELLAIILSFSRGALLALSVCAILYIVRKGFKRYLGILFVGILVTVLIGNYVIKSLDIDYDLIEARFSIKEMKEDKGSSRGDIWSAYLSNYDKYIITGTGINNSSSALKGNQLGVWDGYETHNLYLQFLVEYGFVGLILYLLYLRRILIVYKKTKDDFFCLLLMGISFMIVTFFLNIDKGRTMWIAFAIVNMVWSKSILLNRQLVR